VVSLQITGAPGIEGLEQRYSKPFVEGEEHQCARPLHERPEVLRPHEAQVDHRQVRERLRQFLPPGRMPGQDQGHVTAGSFPEQPESLEDPAVVLVLPQVCGEQEEVPARNVRALGVTELLGTLVGDLQRRLHEEYVGAAGIGEVDQGLARELRDRADGAGSAQRPGKAEAPQAKILGVEELGKGFVLVVRDEIDLLVNRECESRWILHRVHAKQDVEPLVGCDAVHVLEEAMGAQGQIADMRGLMVQFPPVEGRAKHQELVLRVEREHVLANTLDQLRNSAGSSRDQLPELNAYLQCHR
jgi:hypothetical protein